MRLLALLPFALLSTPTDASACSIAIDFGQTQPADGTLDVPANGRIVVETFLFAGWPITAQLYDPTALTPIDLSVSTIGSNVVSIGLPALSANLEYEVHIALEDQSLEKRLKISSSGIRDETGPTLGARLDLSAFPNNLGTCGDPGGYIVNAEVDTAADDRGVALYVLYETVGDDGRSVRDARLPVAGAAQTLSAEVPSGDFGSHCYFVEAVDLAGNGSPIASVGCVDVGPLPDGGMRPPPPPMDGGTRATDAGEQEKRRRLSTDDPSCGCTGTGGTGGFLGLLLLGLPWLFRRK